MGAVRMRPTNTSSTPTLGFSNGLNAKKKRRPRQVGAWNTPGCGPGALAYTIAQMFVRCNGPHVPLDREMCGFLFDTMGRVMNYAPENVSEPGGLSDGDDDVWWATTD